MRVRGHGRAAFTLVEILVVILIITILTGILIPVIVSVQSAAKRARIALEVRNIANAIEEYKNKYKDYPPDFSNPQIVRRHIAKAFPRIAPPGNPPLGEPRPGVPLDGGPVWGIDQAEALVFWLGGLSDDPKHPFTGPGGPLKYIPERNLYVANTDRTHKLFDFQQQRVTYGLMSIRGTQFPASSDETELHNVNDPPAELRPYVLIDAFPVYMQEGSNLPYVYFDSRTYASKVLNADGVLVPSYRGFKPLSDAPDPGYVSGRYGAAFPYKSEIENDNFDPTRDTPDMLLHWVNRNSFQLIAPGLDNSYGNVLMLPFEVGAGPIQIPVFIRFPTGAWFHPNEQASVPQSYYKGHADNLTSFSEGRRLEDNQP